MNQYKSNHEFYQSVFDEVHASDKLIMKVQNMTNNKTKKKIYAIRKVACCRRNNNGVSYKQRRRLCRYGSDLDRTSRDRNRQWQRLYGKAD